MISRASLSFLIFSTGAIVAGPADALYRQFLNPPAAYSLMPYWYWNGRITPPDTRREIQAMLAQGVHQAIVFPWDGMAMQYLSEEYWKQVGAALDIARELHFTLNFADEYDWPSGHAWTPPSGGPELSRVLQQHPEFRMQRLEYTEETAHGAGTFRRTSGTQFAVAARLDKSGFVLEDSLTLIPSEEWAVPPGTWLITSYRLTAAVGGHNTRVDLLNHEAVRAYIELVYEEYARRFPQHLGTTLRLTVADHEGAYGVPIAYTPALWSEFQTLHGYDLRGWLPLLVHDTPDARRSKQVRQHYLDTVSQLYVDSFTKQVTDWCTAHKLQHATSLYEEQLYIQVGQAGDMFRHWRAGTAVEIDALLERARMPPDFKEAASVAHFDRKPLVVENQGLQGHATYFSLEKARLGTNMALLWGANLLVPYFDYDQRKVTWPPQWFLGQPFWRYFHHYADYVRRAQFMNAQGEHVAPVLLYYPLETAFANASTLLSNKPHRDLFWNNAMDQTQNFYSALQLELARQGWDYHIADAAYLRNAAIRGNTLEIGSERFRVVILPPMTDIDTRSEEKLYQFERAGGSVLRLGSAQFPVREHKPFMDRLDYMAQIEVPADVREDLQPVLEALRRIDPPQVELLGRPAHLYFSHRRSAGVDWYWMVNDSGESRTVEARFPGSGRLEKWEAETGRRTPLSDTLTFDPWDAYFVVQTIGPPLAPQPATQRKLLLELPGAGWRFTPEQPYIDVPYAKDQQGQAVWLAPERLSNSNWWLTGPFPYDDHRGFFTAYPPERGFDPSAGWKWHESPTYTVTLRDALNVRGDRAPGVYYAYVNIYSPAERAANILTAFADSEAVWWNGAEVLRVHRHPKWSLLRDHWAERAPVHVRQGWNTALLKIGPSLMVPTAFLFRVVDAHGETVRDLVYSRDRELRPQPKFTGTLRVVAPPGTIGPAEVTLQAGAEPEHPVRFKTGTVPFTLQSWTDSSLAHYSGTALYETNFELLPFATNSKLQLDLGAVGVTAEVWLNGKSCGERVWRPYAFDISRQAHAGTNTLRIRIANSDAGWQSQGDTVYPRGSWGLHYKTELDRVPTIRPNGLEGPVRILIESR